MNEPSWKSLLLSGKQAVARGQGAHARALLQKAQQLAPLDRDVRYWLANALRLDGEVMASEELFRHLLLEFPADTDAAFALAFLLRAEGHPEPAASVLLGLAKQHQDDLDTLLKIAGFLRDSNCFREAVEVMRFALRFRPEDAQLLVKLARLLQALGQFDEALACLRAALDSNPGLGGAWLSLAQLQKFTDPQSADWQRIIIANQHPSGEEARMCLAFARGKGLDDLGEWADAWSEYSRGNRLRHAAQPWNRQAWNRFLAGALKSSPSRSPGAAVSRRHPVFVVGMLRSGTTLLEQLLDCHPLITGRGELNNLAHLVTSLAGRKLGSIAERKAAGDEIWVHMRLDGPTNHFYIDKNPLNFRFLDTLLDVLPEARIIHLERDGRDSCMSCFFQLFQHPDAGFSNALDDLVDYYRGYKRLMAHFVASSGDRIHSLSYADLALTPHQAVDGVLDFLGLESEIAIAEITQERPVRTASSWQARQEVHQSSLGRWKNYYPMAPGFFEALAGIDNGDY